MNKAVKTNHMLAQKVVVDDLFYYILSKKNCLMAYLVLQYYSALPHIAELKASMY
jgi:hypothetical protein